MQIYRHFGMSPAQYDLYLQSPEWEEKRRATIMRDGNQCTQCGATGQTMTVHHVRYRETRELETIDDLTTLCKPCHKAFHDAERAQANEQERHRRKRAALDPVTRNMGKARERARYKAEKLRLSTPSIADFIGEF